MGKVYKSRKTERRAIEARLSGVRKNKEKGLENSRIYLKSPKLCLRCYNTIPYNRRRNNFCSSSCSATYNNLIRHKLRNKKEKYCLHCGREKIRRNSKKYCSQSCSMEHRKKITIEKHEEKYILGKMNDEEARRHFRRINAHKCSICFLEYWNEKEIPLEVDHVDGNTKNNFPSNLRFVCRNCGAQLPTAGSKNRNSGRVDKRSKWYYELNKEKE